MRLSVVIPAHNEELLLPRTLAALSAALRDVLADAGAAVESAEIIVTDDSSTDATGDLARAAGARVVPIQRRQIAAARNAGAQAATGDAIVFVDADTVVPAAVLRAALAALRSGAAGGGAFPRFDGHIPLYARFLLRLVVAALRAGRTTGGCFLFCTRAAFDASGGFDESLYASEEVWFCRALGRQPGGFVILPETVITSGRKVRGYSALETFGFLLGLTLRPWRLRRREGLDLWYGPRRPDPQGPAPGLPPA